MLYHDCALSAQKIQKYALSKYILIHAIKLEYPNQYICLHALIDLYLIIDDQHVLLELIKDKLNDSLYPYNKRLQQLLLYLNDSTIK